MPWCDDCKYSEFDFREGIELECKRGHEIEFITPSRLESKRRWGWIRAEAFACPDYSEIGTNTPAHPEGPWWTRLGQQSSPLRDRHDEPTPGGIGKPYNARKRPPLRDNNPASDGLQRRIKHRETYRRWKRRD
jgi:hypothetical protein